MTEVCLLVEGGYPYAAGGVSEWVDRLIGAQPQLSFSVAHLDDPDARPSARAYGPKTNLGRVADVDCEPGDERLSGAAAQVPEADVYHALSTGLAGAVAARVAAQRGRPLLLTEHGLAWREAALAIDACRIHGCRIHGRVPGRTPAERAEHRADWSRRVARMAGDTYARADAITSVCAANARAQLRLGAPPARLRVIPNPAPTPGAAPAASLQPTGGPAGRGKLARPRIGLVGRVVPIKDVLTFVRACARVARAIPAARFEVIGPLDHDPSYAERCQALAHAVGLGNRMRFLGSLPSDHWPARLDVLVLTSRSEAAPLVLLEAMAASVPVVATDVGGCAELVGARPGRGPQAHPAGLLTPSTSPRATAEAIERVCSDAALRGRLAASGQARALGRHRQASIAGAYRSLYQAALEGRLAA